MRLFLGIPLAAEVIGELASTVARLRLDDDGLRWTEPESWHVTLQFLGNAGREEYNCMVARLRELRVQSVPMRLEPLGFFDRSGILLAGVKVTPELLLVQRRVTAATRLCGFVPDARPYQPHITLARSKGNGQRQGIAALKTKIGRPQTFTGFVAEEFLLYESFLGPGGSRYEIRERFALGGP
jgi:2'-5' RNA ligase